MLDFEEDLLCIVKIFFYFREFGEFEEGDRFCFGKFDRGSLVLFVEFDLGGMFLFRRVCWKRYSFV